MRILTTPGGVRFGLCGEKKAAPAPILFIFAQSLDVMQRDRHYTEPGRILAKHGFLWATLEPPCHGGDVRPGEPRELLGWRARLEKGEDFVAAWTARASAVLDHLIKEGYTAPSLVAACGTSRGGFLAYHWAAADRRVQGVAGFSPVTDLLAVTEFASLAKHEATRNLSLKCHATKLADRAFWLSIGHDDRRVSTDESIAFARAVMAAALARTPKGKEPPAMELIVGPPAGHTIIPDAHARAAAWILKQIERARNDKSREGHSSRP
jgi:dienelactone hydrolase